MMHIPRSEFPFKSSNSSVRSQPTNYPNPSRMNHFPTHSPPRDLGSNSNPPIRQSASLCQHDSVRSSRPRKCSVWEIASPSKLEKAIKWTTLIICLTGMSFQLTLIFKDYFKYEMVSEVYIEKRDHVRPPAMSICLRYSEVMDLKAAGYQEPDWSKMTADLRNQLAKKVQAGTKIKNIFKFTPEFKDLLVDFWVRKADTYSVENDSNSFTVHKFIRDEYICYKFAYSGQINLDFHLLSHHITFGRKPGSTMLVGLNKTKLKNVSHATYYMNRWSMYPRGDRDYPLEMVNDKGTVFTDPSTFWGLTYNKYTLKLLQPPFRTACRTYQRSDSDENCRDTCLKDKTIAKYGKDGCIFTSTFTNRSENSPYKDVSMMSRYTVINNASLAKEIDRLIYSCDEVCPDNCNRVWFVPILLTRRISDRVVWQMFDMNGPEFKLLFQPKLGMIGLMVQIISICGIWMGISCADIVRKGIVFAAKVCLDDYLLQFTNCL